MTRTTTNSLVTIVQKPETEIHRLAVIVMDWIICNDQTEMVTVVCVFSIQFVKFREAHILKLKLMVIKKSIHKQAAYLLLAWETSHLSNDRLFRVNQSKWNLRLCIVHEPVTSVINKLLLNKLFHSVCLI